MSDDSDPEEPPSDSEDEGVCSVGGIHPAVRSYMYTSMGQYSNRLMDLLDLD